MLESERNNLHVFLQVGTLKVFTSRHAEPLVQVVIHGVESLLLTAEAHRGRQSLICYRDQGQK
jgi:hypothetical protein